MEKFPPPDEAMKSPVLENCLIKLFFYQEFSSCLPRLFRCGDSFHQNFSYLLAVECSVWELFMLASRQNPVEKRNDVIYEVSLVKPAKATNRPSLIRFSQKSFRDANEYQHDSKNLGSMSALPTHSSAFASLLKRSESMLAWNYMQKSSLFTVSMDMKKKSFLWLGCAVGMMQYCNKSGRVMHVKVM